MKIGIDIDGVIYNFPEALRLYLIENRGRKREDLPNPTCWDFFVEQWNVSLSDYLEIYNSESEFLFTRGPKIKDYKLQALNRLKEMGHEIILITNRVIHHPDLWTYQERLYRAETYTRVWLDNNLVPYDELHLGHEKTKSALCVDYHVDDHWVNLDLMKAANSNLKTLLYRRPYNDFISENYSSISSLDELGTIVMADSVGKRICTFN